MRTVVGADSRLRLKQLEDSLRLAKSRGAIGACSDLVVEIYRERQRLREADAGLWEEIYGGKVGRGGLVGDDELTAGDVEAAREREEAEANEVKEGVERRQEAEVGEIDFSGILEDREAARTLMLGQFTYFIAVMHKYLYGGDFVFKPFHISLIKKLEDFVLGKQKKRNLYIGLAPRMGKSQLVKYFCAWCYALNPRCCFMATSYDDDLAENISDEVKKILESKLYQEIFCGVELEKRSKSKGIWKTTMNGTFRAASMRGGLTGHGGGVLSTERVFGGAIIIDDFQKPFKGYSEADNEEIKRLFYETIKSRKNAAETPILIIAQRISENDLIADIKETEGDDWEFFEVPTLQNGRSIWEERISTADLIKMRDTKKELFYSQYQQDPRPRGGEMIKGEWFRYYQPNEQVSFKRIFGVFDTALKKGQEHDYTAGGLFGLSYRGLLYWLDLFHAKLTVPEVERSILLKWREWRAPINGKACECIYIEDKASGTSIIQNLRQKNDVLVMPIKVVEDKIQRVNDAIPYIATGQVYLPVNRYNFMSKTIVNEVEMFNSRLTAPHDDIVDVLCHACRIAYSSHSGLF